MGIAGNESYDIFDEVSDLNQELFFDPVKVAPTSSNPLKSVNWDKYIELRKKMNEKLDNDYKVIKIVILSNQSFIEGRYVTSYYQELISANEDCHKRMTQMTELGRSVVDIVTL